MQCASSNANRHNCVVHISLTICFFQYGARMASGEVKTTVNFMSAISIMDFFYLDALIQDCAAIMLFAAAKFKTTL